MVVVIIVNMLISGFSFRFDSYMCMWLDEKQFKKRTWYWIIINKFGLFLQQFCLWTVAISLHLHLGTVSEFGEYLNVCAGASLGLSKMVFLMTYRKEVTELMDSVAELNSKLKEKAQKDMEIRRMRNSYYLLECVLTLSSFIFSMIFEFAVYIQGLLVRPIILRIPSTTPFGFHESLMGFIITYLFQFLGSAWVAMFMCISDFMIGSNYNQLILNVEVMRHELRTLGSGQENLNAIDQKEQFIRIIKEYQYLREIANRFNQCFEPYLLIHVLLTMVVVTFISIELAIVINIDPMSGLRPLMYLIFMNSTFFYWCWLGDRLYQLVNRMECGLLLLVFI